MKLKLVKGDTAAGEDATENGIAPDGETNNGTKVFK